MITILHDLCCSSTICNLVSYLWAIFFTSAPYLLRISIHMISMPQNLLLAQLCCMNLTLEFGFKCHGNIILNYYCFT
jgi:hypothetical protein